MADVSGDGESFEAQMEAVAKDATKEAANEWHSKSIEMLYQRGDEHEFDVYPIAQSSLPPEWDDAEEAWAFVFPHVAAPILQFGADEHEIEAKNAEYLAFEWPDAPPEIRERFEETFPTVFFKSVEHPGVPALHWLSDSWKEVFGE